MTNNSSYLERFNDVINIVSSKTGVSVEKIRKIIDSFFRNFKRAISDPRMPTIKLTNVGTFRPSIKKINYYLKRGFHLYRSERIDKDKMTSRINKVWKVRRRIQEEREGINTWDKWKNIKTEDNAKK